MISRVQSKLFRPTGDVKFRITNERLSGVNRVRIEGEVFGARGSTLKHFGSAAERDFLHGAGGSVPRGLLNA